jgi:branched-chain amino acid transport system substrate-binding protein
VKIAVIASKTGPLEAYAKQTIVGFNMGLEYATGGTMTVAGRKLVVIEKDDQGKPDVGKACWPPPMPTTRSTSPWAPPPAGVALAMLPVAEEYKKILLVEPAVADSITGDKWNKYIFRTGRNSSQDAAANAAALDQPGNVIAVLANDNAFGRDGVKAFKEFTKKAKIVHEEYLPVGTTDFTAGLQRIIDKLKDQPGNKYLSVGWAGARRRSTRSPTSSWKSATASSWPPAATSCRRWWPTRTSPAWKARCTTTSASPRTRSTSGWWPTTTASSRHRPTSSPPAA